jgi:hypothetical protein
LTSRNESGLSRLNVYLDLDYGGRVRGNRWLEVQFQCLSQIVESLYFSPALAVAQPVTECATTRAYFRSNPSTTLKFTFAQAGSGGSKPLPGVRQQPTMFDGSHTVRR